MAREQTVLLVDDDRSLVDVVAMALEDAGFRVVSAFDGLQGWRSFSAHEPDLVVLDLVMPELDGLELCKKIREQHTTPIIMLTSRAEGMDKVLGLDLGADDYVTKPFSTRELVARIRAALRRVALDRGVGDDAVRTLGPLELDRGRREVRLNARPIAFTVTEFELLWTLTDKPGRVCTRQDLVDRVYGGEVVVSDRTIDTFVKRVRRKLSEIDPSFDAVDTVRGVGYRYRE